MRTRWASTVVDDPSNRDPRHLRNRVRHELLPLLDELAGRDVAPVLARQAGLLRGDDDLLDELAASLDPTDARGLAAAPGPRPARRARAGCAGSTRPTRPRSSGCSRVAGGCASGCEHRRGPAESSDPGNDYACSSEPSATPSRLASPVRMYRLDGGGLD